MDIKCFPNGMFESNSYVVTSGNDSIIIDAGVSADQLIEEVYKKKDNKVKYIVLTHGHLDHICCLGDLYETTGAEILIHTEDAEMLGDPNKNLSSMGYSSISYDIPYKTVNDGDEFKFGDSTFSILHTPGHTLGGICIKIGDNIFTGDTLFKNSVGRSDFPGGNHFNLIKNIREKLMVFETTTKIYPGHGPSSTIGEEEMFNPYL